MTSEDREVIKELQKTFANEVLERELKLKEQIYNLEAQNQEYRRFIRKQKRVMTSALITIVIFLFVWAIGYFTIANKKASGELPLKNQKNIICMEEN